MKIIISLAESKIMYNLIKKLKTVCYLKAYCTINSKVYYTINSIRLNRYNNFPDSRETLDTFSMKNVSDEAT